MKFRSHILGVFLLLGIFAAAAAQPTNTETSTKGISTASKDEATKRATQLQMKTFKINKKMFDEILNLQGTNYPTKLSETYLTQQSRGASSAGHNYTPVEINQPTPSMKAAFFLGQNGVDIYSPPGKSIFYNDRLGLFLIKATPSDLELIEKVFSELKLEQTASNTRMTGDKASVINNSTVWCQYQQGGLLEMPIQIWVHTNGDVLVQGDWRIEPRFFEYQTQLGREEQSLLADLIQKADFMQQPKYGFGKLECLCSTRWKNE